MNEVLRGRRGIVADSDTLYVAVPHRGSQQAEIRVFETT